MNTELIARKTKRALGTVLELDPDTILESQSLEADLGADSLDVVEIVIETENELLITIPDADADEVKTVADLIKLATRLVTAREGL